MPLPEANAFKKAGDWEWEREARTASRDLGLARNREKKVWMRMVLGG